MSDEIKKALLAGKYICQYCARNDEKVVELIPLTRRQIVFHCETCLTSYHTNYLDEMIDGVES